MDDMIMLRDFDIRVQYIRCYMCRLANRIVRIRRCRCEIAIDKPETMFVGMVRQKILGEFTPSERKSLRN